MINKLKSLHLENFRLFEGEYDIPLDADVVLVHGNNGCGKSSLLYGVEFALTGTVLDLEAFDRDFPRCLRNVKAEAIAVSSLSVQGELQDDTVYHASISPENKTILGNSLDESSSRLFVERSFLSQTRLSRLLEMYQTCEKGSTETPLIAFVKRLLQLDYLDDLGAALHDLGDRRRMKKAFPAYGKLEDATVRLNSRQKGLQEKMRQREEDYAKTLSALGLRHEVISKQQLPEDWSEEAIAKLREFYRDELAEQASTSQRSTLLNDALQRVAELRAVLNAIFSSPSEHDDDLEAKEVQLRQRLSENEAEIREKLSQFLDKNSSSQWNAKPSPKALWDHTVQQASESLTSVQLGISSRIADETEIAETRKNLSDTRGELQDALTQIADIASELPKWSDTLAILSQHVTSNECPVCQRDFGEVGDTSLREFLESRLVSIGEQSEHLKRLESQKASLQMREKEMQARFSALEKRLADKPPMGQLEKDAVRLSEVNAALDALKPKVQEWLDASNSLVQVRSRLELSRVRRQQLADGEVFLKQASSDLNWSTALPHPLAERLSGLESHCCKELERRQELRENIQMAARHLDELQQLQKRQEDFDREWLDLDEKGQAILQAKEKVEETIASGRKLLNATVHAKRKLLNRVFDQQLNRLWLELFERLVRNEDFRPRLAEPTSWRDQIRSAIQAVTENAEPFENLGSIHSLGNLNTAALSLFLALNLVESDSHKVIILDDPVQSMDDVHVTQFALLLRALVERSGRQMVLAVHEKALFDFLRFELAPANAGRSLMAIELSRSGSGTDVNISHDAWEPDEVQIPTSAAS